MESVAQVRRIIVQILLKFFFLFHKAAFSLDLNSFSLQSHSLSHVQLYNKEFAAAAQNLQFMSVYN